MIYFFYLVAEKMQEKKLMWFDAKNQINFYKFVGTTLPWCYSKMQTKNSIFIFYKKNRPALFIPADRPNTKWLNLKNPPKTHTLSSAFSDSLRSWLTLGATAPVSPQRRKHSSLFTADHLVLYITLFPTFSFSINYSLSLSK